MLTARSFVVWLAALALAACSANATSDADSDSPRRPRDEDPDRPGVGDGGASNDEDADSTADADPGDGSTSADGQGGGPSDTGVDPDSGAVDSGGPERDILAPPDVAADATVDGFGVYDPDGGGPVDPVVCPESAIVPPLCVASLDEGLEGLCEGLDNDCDGDIDEGCPCKLGDVRPCFEGPPGRVETGACAPGTMRCQTAGGGNLVWGACEGGIAPGAEVCDTLDNDCNGCVDEVGTCAPGGSCPGPDDPRTPDATPFTDYPLRGGDFYTGAASAWSWTIQGGPCDSIVPGRSSFTLTGANSQNATFRPSLSGSYTVTLRVTTPDGIFTCTWVIHVVGPGIRIEMCYPESTTQDLDLFMMRTTTPGNWFPPSGDVFDPNPDACGWFNCEASIRGSSGRVSWGYGNSPVENCSGGPQGAQWTRLGYCANPRLDIDNNLSEGTGVPENINLDNPRVGDAFRIMVHNFSGPAARPVVNIYCGGRLRATFGAAPDIVTPFVGSRASVSAMWRVADIVTTLDPDGITDCEVTALHPPGASSGYDVTVENSRW
jgi:hypothetical protein